MKIIAITPIEKKSSKIAKVAKKGVAVAAGIAMGLAASSIYNAKNNKNNNIDNGNYGKVMIIIQNDTAKKYDFTQGGKFKYQFNDTQKSDNTVKPDKVEPKYEKVEPEVLPDSKDVQPDKVEPKYEKVEPEILPEIKDVQPEKVEPEKVTPEVQPEKKNVTGKGSLELIAREVKLKYDIKDWKELQEIYTDLGNMAKVSELQTKIEQAEAERVILQKQIAENARSREEAKKNQ